MPVSGPLNPGTHAMTHTSAWDGTEQPYNLFIPSAHTADNPLPLVVVLHGITATWKTWFEAVTIRETAEREGWIVAAPHGRGDIFYLGAGEADVLEVIADVKRLCHVNEDRVFLMGHSMGGWGTWSIACSHPDLFAAIAPMSGWAPLERLENLDHLAPIIFHGADDIPVPVDHSREADARLTVLGIEHCFTELPGVGHESSMISDVLPQIADWFRGRHRAANPERIRIRTWTPARGSNRWLAVLEMRDRRGLASLDGEMGSSGDVRIAAENIARFRLEPQAMPLPTGGISVLIVNGEQVSLSGDCSQPFIVVTLDKAGWHAESVSNALPPPSPVAMHFPEGCNDVPAWVGEVLATRFDVDAAVIHRNHVQPTVPPGDLTLDDLADLHLRPMDLLCLIELPLARLGKIASLEGVPEWWGEAVIAPTPSGTQRQMRIVCIAQLARLLNLSAVPLHISVAQALLDHAQLSGGQT